MAGSIFANDDTGAITFLDGLNVQNPYRGSGFGVTSGTASSVVVTMPNGTQDKDGLLAAITFIQGTTITPPAGWTAIDSSSGSSGVTLNTYYRIASSEPGSYTWNFGTAITATGTISRFVGVNTTTPLDTDVSVSGQGSVTSVQPTTTLTQKSTSNLAVIFTGVRPDSSGTPVLTMPSTSQWTAPADAAATATGNSFPAVQGMSYKINGTTTTPTVTTNVACEFGVTTVSLNVAFVAATNAETSSSTESSSIAATASSSDTGSGTDTNTALHIASTTTDAAGATVEANTLTANVPASDTGSGLEGTPAIAATASSSDSGTGLDAQGNPQVTTPGDTGSVVESTAIAVTMPTQADTSTSVEASSIQVTMPTQADTSSSTEANTLTVKITQTETSTSVESASIAVASTDVGSSLEAANLGISSSDSGSGTDTSTTLSVTLSSSDTATGTDTNTSLHEAATSADTASSVEANSIAVALSNSDTGSFTETDLLGVPLISADTFTGIEATSLTVNLSASDTASGVDSSVLTIPSSDSMTGVDNQSVVIQINSADTASSSEASFLNASVSDGDTGSLDDQGSGGLVDTDFITTLEQSSILVTTSASDAFTGTDVSSTGISDSDSFTATEGLTVGPRSTDAASFTEGASVRVAVSAADTGAGIDSSRITADVHEADVFTYTENTAIAFAVADSDFGFGFDDSSVPATAVSDADTATATENILPLHLTVGQAESLVGVDAESAEDRISSSDAGTLVSEAVSIRVGFTDSISFAEVGVIHVSSSDSMVGIDSTNPTGIQAADSGIFTEVGKIGVRLSDSLSLIDDALIKLTFPVDTMSAVESASKFEFGIPFHVSDTFTASEAWGLRVSVAGDSFHATDAHRIGVADEDFWDPQEIATISFKLTDGLTASEAASVASGPPRDSDALHAVEHASIQILNLGGVPRLGPSLNPLAPLQPYYLRRQQRWAVDNERQRHLQALYMYGEWTMFVLMWHVEDFNAGLVDKCHRCFGAPGQPKTAENRRSAAYGNVNEYRCPNCFGTTFEGGFKSIIVRPAIFGDTDESQQYGQRGVSNPGELDLESTPDFRVRSGDYSFRSTGDRYFLRVPDRVTLRTGFATPYQRTDAIGYNHAKAAIQDATSVSYSIPPSREDLVSILNVQSSYTPVDFSAFEIIRSPLIPVSEDQG